MSPNGTDGRLHVGPTCFDDTPSPGTKGKAVSADERIAALASRQHGAFSRSQACAVGFTPAGIRHRRSTGRWLDVAPGVYVIAGTAATWQQLVITTLLSYGPSAAAASTTAARLRGIIESSDGMVCVVVPKGQHRRTKKGTRVREAKLTRSDIRVVDGITCTAPNRTIVDLAAVFSQAQLEAALDTAILRGMTTAASLRTYIRERRLGKRSGLGMLRRLLEDRINPAPQSELERMFLRKLRAAGLPEPTRQHPIGKRRVDFAYPDRKIAIELDGRAFHASGIAFREDPRRRNELVLAGWHPFQFTWDDITKDWPTTEAVLRAALGLPN